MALHRRARDDAVVALDRRDRPRGAARRAAFVPVALHLIIAPVWRIHDVATAYSGVKYLDVFVMTSVLFPTYFLARMVVGAAGRSSPRRRGGDSLARVLVVDRRGDLAYPYAALCFLLIAKALHRAVARLGRRRDRRVARRAARARRAGRDPGRLRLAVLFVLWSSDRSATRRRPGRGATTSASSSRARGDRRAQRASLSHHSGSGTASRRTDEARGSSSRRLGGRRARDRDRRHSVRPRAGRARSGARRGRAELRMFRASPPPPMIGFGTLHRHEGRVPLDELRDAARGAEPDLHRAALFIGDRARPRPPAREPRCARGRCRVRASTSSSAPRSPSAPALLRRARVLVLQQANRYYEYGAAGLPLLRLPRREPSRAAEEPGEEVRREEHGRHHQDVDVLDAGERAWRRRGSTRAGDMTCRATWNCRARRAAPHGRSRRSSGRSASSRARP